MKDLGEGPLGAWTYIRRRSADHGSAIHPLEICHTSFSAVGTPSAVNLFSVRGMTMKALGIHLIVEFCSCNRRKLDALEYLERTMSQAATTAGATVLRTAFQDFNPQGVSGVVVIAESHLTIHTWPEFGYAAVDIFTCGMSVDPWKAVKFLEQELESERTEVQSFQRGLPDGMEVEDQCRLMQHAACGYSHR